MDYGQIDTTGLSGETTEPDRSGGELKQRPFGCEEAVLALKKMISIAEDLLTWCIEPDKKFIYEGEIAKAKRELAEYEATKTPTHVPKCR